MDSAKRSYVDGPLLVALLVLSAMSLLVLYSSGGEDTGLVWRQFIRLFVAILALFALTMVPPDALRR